MMSQRAGAQIEVATRTGERMEHLRAASVSAGCRLIPVIVLCTCAMSGIAGAETPRAQLAERVAEEGSPKATETFGLSEEQREEAFREALAAEERAANEASEQHRNDPESMKQVETEGRLSDFYSDAVASKFGLTRKQLVLVVAEGYEKGWSSRPPPAVEVK